MCFIRLKNYSDALKIEAAHAVQNYDYDEALSKRELASKILKTALNLESSQPLLQYQAYLDYWAQITAGYVSLLKGEFEKSRKSFAQALATLRLLNDRKVFPNYFSSRAEIAAHQYYIDAVECVSLGDFVGAKSKFSTWLDANADKAPTFRSENISIFVVVCDILGRLLQNNLPPQDWKTLERLLERQYTAKTTWALWRRLEWLRELAIKSSSAHGVFTNETLYEEVKNFTKEWRLFVLDAVLKSEDQDVSMERKVSYLSLIYIFDNIDPSRDDWRGLLLQNLRHMLLLMADYESRRYLEPPDDDPKHPIENPLKFTEDMSTKELIKVIKYYLRIRSEDHATAFERASEHLDSMFTSIGNGEYTVAVEAQRSFFEAVRFWPHVIVVTEQSDLPHHLHLEEDTSEFLLYRTRVRRLWREMPNEMVFEGPQCLSIGSFYFLRPGWNARKKECYRIRHELFYESNLPRWIETFVNNLIGKGKVNAQKFHDWILQFPEGDRLIACRLMAGMQIIQNDDIGILWKNVFRQLSPEAKRDAVFIGVGHGAKSGRLAPYAFKQGICDLPEYDGLFKGREKIRFRDLAEFEKESLNLMKPSIIVFLDDFIGVGGQASEFNNWYHKHYTWLKDVRIYFSVLAGFKTAIENKLKPELGDKIADVIVGQILDENDRAFSPLNPIWSSPAEASAAAKWAGNIGMQILKGKEPYVPDRDNLGWHGCEALISFPHNVPSDTIPLFWADGYFEGKQWKPLFHRSD